MSELRREPIYGRTVLIAPQRMARPHALQVTPWRSSAVTDSCPFCRGREHLTPPACLTLPAAETDWLVRVFPNRYPALIPPLQEPGPQASAGLHEVVIESPQHIASLVELPQEHFSLVLQAYRQRLLSMRQSGWMRWALVFKNQGPEAGASQYHLHSQIMGFTVLSPAMTRALAYTRQYWTENGRCAICDLLGEELQNGDRVVAEHRNWLAFCPAASRCPYEAWIVPRPHADCFTATTDEQLSELAQFMSTVLARLERHIPEISYNFTIYSAPFDTQRYDHYHWHIVICPRVARLAGCELFADIYINPIEPAEAARQLRLQSVLPD